MIDEIIQLTGQKNHPISKSIEFWIASSERYKDFVRSNKNKIRGKCRAAKSYEDLEDVRFELEIPYLLLLNNRFSVEYEKYFAENKRSPDFTVTFENIFEFNVEVKRIQEHAFGKRYRECLNKIVEEIKKTPSILGFYLEMVSADGTEEFINTLENQQAEIIQFIKKKIMAEESNIQIDSSIEYEVPNLSGRLILSLTKILQEANPKETLFLGVTHPIFYTQKEFVKIGADIFDKLGQMIPGMVNILIFNTDSSTHDPEDLYIEISSINNKILKNDDSFFSREKFDGTQGFLSLDKYLSGIMFMSTWKHVDPSNTPKPLWFNERAENPIPNSIRKYLSEMTTYYH